MLKNCKNILFLKQLPQSLKHGFTLLELTMVIAIIALVVGMGVTSMQTLINSAEITATRAKMKAIDEALLAYWRVNGRLPCPADMTLSSSNGNYGVEAANNDAGCTGGTPAAVTFATPDFRHTAEGMIPIAALNLPESYALDGWSGRFRYIVDTQMTRPNASSRLHTNSECPGVLITKQQSSYNYTTYKSSEKDEYAYALLSHGKNRFGSYSDQGTKITNDLATEEEGVNAWTEISNPYGTHADTRFGYIDGSDSYSGFDDILSYKTLWQLNEGQHKKQGLLKDVPILFIATDDGPDYAMAYYWDGQTFVKHTDVGGTAATGSMEGGILAPGNMCQQRIFYGNAGGTPNTYSYRLTTHYSNTLTGTTGSGLSGVDANGFGYHPSREYAAVTLDASPYVGFLSSWSRTGSSYCTTGCPMDTDPTGEAFGADISVNGHLAVAHDNSPYVSIYYDSTDPNEKPQEKLPNPVVLPAGNANDAAYSPDGRMLAVAHETSPYITIYEVNGTSYTKYSDPATLPTGTANAVSFSSDGQYLAVAHASDPYITVYAVDAAAGTFTKLDDPTTKPDGMGRDVDFASGENIFAVAVDSGEPALLLYKIQNGIQITKMADPAYVVGGGDTVFSVKFSPSDLKYYNKGIITDGLVGRWRFDENTGSTTADSSSRGNDGTMTGPPAFSTQVPSNLTGSAHSMYFDGTNDRVAVPDDTELQLTDQLTISLWIRPTVDWDSASKHVPFVNKQNTNTTGNNSYVFLLNQSTDTLHLGTSGGYIQGTQSDWDADVWYHFVATYDYNGGSELGTLYINGVEDPASANTLDSMSATTNQLWIGENSNTGYQDFAGQMDDVRIYNRVLTAEEVKRIYDGNG